MTNKKKPKKSAEIIPLDQTGRHDKRPEIPQGWDWVQALELEDKYKGRSVYEWVGIWLNEQHIITGSDELDVVIDVNHVLRVRKGYPYLVDSDKKVIHLLIGEDERQLDSITAVEEFSAGGASLEARYIYIQPRDEYFDIDTFTAMKAVAVNKAYATTKLYVPTRLPDGGVGKKLAAFTNWLPFQEGFKTAQGYTWFPEPYASKSEDALVKIGPRLMVNTWEGFALTPIKGDVQPWLDHIAHLFPDVEHQRRVIQWIKFMVESPHVKCNWQLLIYGIEGAGKDAAFKPIGQIFGSAAGNIGNRSIKGNFDDGFARRKFVVVNEISDIKGDALEGLKSKCASETAETQLLNPKGKFQVEQFNLWAVALLTNNHDAIAVSPNERRFYALMAETPMSEAQRKKYFDWLENRDGAAKLFAYLLSGEVDMSDFNPNELPERTEAFKRVLVNTSSEADDVLTEWVETEEGRFWDDVINIQELTRQLHIMGVRDTNTKDVKTWASKNGWSLPKCGRVVKKLDGKTESKSKWYWVKTDGELFDASAAEVYDAIEEWEADHGSSMPSALMGLHR